MMLDLEADSKIFLQKRAVLENKFEKHLLKQHFFTKVSMNQRCSISNKTKFKKENLFKTDMR